MLNQLNHSFITLIPKGEKAVVVSQFKPIVVYKAISKILANRLKTKGEEKKNRIIVGEIILWGDTV